MTGPEGPFTSAKELAAYWIKRAEKAEAEVDRLRAERGEIRKAVEDLKCAQEGRAKNCVVMTDDCEETLHWNALRRLKTIVMGD